MIQNIEVSKISPHYDNPRKNLGDLTELAESIKANGILQNLTVVPWFSKLTGVGADDPKQQEELGYIVVIGHRRLAAAKLAGLTEVPCSISNMSLRKQISTMLLENMQRSDLTIYEQAQGFQMMLDLGESINDLSEKTGFSKTTVRSRIKLLEFDKEKFRKSVERGGTLMDYAELDKINDTALRNKVLDKIGTKDFAWNLQQAIEKETSEKNKALIIAEVEKFATQIKDVTGYKYFKSYYPSRDVEVVAPEDIDTVEYFFSITEYGYITLYIKANDNNTSSSQTPAWLEKQRERDAHRAVMDEVSKRAYKLRRKFIKEVSSSIAKKNIGTITEFLLWSTIKYSADISLEDLASFFDIQIEEKEDADEDFFNSCFSIIAEHIHDQPERHLLAAAYLLTDSPQEKYYSWDNQFNDNETLNAVYDFLENLGYEISEEESAMCDGTHKLYVSAEGK